MRISSIAPCGACSSCPRRPPCTSVTTTRRARHLLEANELADDIRKAVNAHLARKGLLLKRGSIVDATIIAAPSSTKNSQGERDPEMHQTKKGNEWHFGMKAHIAVDADSGLVHTVTTTAANEADVEQVADLLHGKEQNVWADSGYRGAQSRVDRDGLQWHIAARPSDIAKLPEGRAKQRLKRQERSKASVRAKVEHPFRVIKRQFGLLKDVVAAKWLLWNGRKERCFGELEALRRETGGVGAHNPLGGLIRYLRGCSALLVNYPRRRALRLPISSAGAESVVDYLIGQRLKRNGHMRWTREGANSLLQVRCAVLNGLDVRNFKRWYPPGKQFAPLPRARLLS